MIPHAHAPLSPEYRLAPRVGYVDGDVGLAEPSEPVASSPSLSEQSSPSLSEQSSPSLSEHSSPSLSEHSSPWPIGRLVELASSATASARTTVAVREVARLQREGELVAWVQVRGGTFYPPDAAEAGVDLAALTVVHVPSSALEAARAAELLLRSGAFGLVVVDLEGMLEARLPSRALARLHALCRQHGSTVSFLTPPAHEALGSLVSLRFEPRRNTLHARLEHTLEVPGSNVEHAVSPNASPNAVSSNAVSSNAVSSNAVSSNAVSSNAVSSNAVSSNAVSSNAEALSTTASEDTLAQVETSAELHVVESHVLRDKLGHEPARSIHRGPLGLTSDDEVTRSRKGVVVPFRRRADATLPLPFEARFLEAPHSEARDAS
ncbi:MAG: hypothetical protein H6721_17435 [Sandaracinus sp.]|nr:hypothetical protein [Sandaracinus sp.]